MPEALAKVRQFEFGIAAIDTDYVRPVFDASHLIVDAGQAAFVDTGTDYAVPLLLDALAQQDIDVADVKYVFITHAHLDHAGGAGRLLKALPNAVAVLHPRAAPHMIDPSKLIKGTIAVYGEEGYRQIYNDVVAIPDERIVIAEDGDCFRLGARELESFHTEGHARHHYCLHDRFADAVFCGDSFGVSYRELDTDKGEFIFPSTTPIDFDPQEAHRTVDRIMALEPAHLYLTHYSRINASERIAADMHTGIDYFVNLARRCAGEENRTQLISARMFEHFAAALIDHGYDGAEDRIHNIHKILDFDIRLNTMGLEVWLERTQQAQ